MQAFMKSVKATNNSRQSAIKSSITTQLSETVKDIQLCSIEEGDSLEAKNNLCSVIEAIFLHGLKDSIAHRFRKAISDVDQRPEPNFWSPLLIILHRESIEQIQQLKQITTDIGHCRAWIRLSLNEALLSSYLMTIRQNPSALKSYYNTFAYIRDIDELEVAQKYIEGIESIDLELPYNNSLLNSWPVPTLLLAGIWSPTLRTCPISSGVDVAQSMQATSSANSETSSITSLMSQSSGIGQMIHLNEDEALKIILAKHSQKREREDNQMVPEKLSTPSESESEDQSGQAAAQGNSLNRQTGWSFDENNTESEKTEPTEPLDNAKSMEHSFNALVENSYNMLAGTHIRTPDFREVWQKLESSTEKPQEPQPIVVKDVPPPRNQPLILANNVSVIAKELGLDNQDYKCATCKDDISFVVKSYVCALTGEYFCGTCISKDEIPIPARIIHNWDFKVYQVSEKALKYIEEIKDHPVIDFKTANPYIYTAVEEMAKLQILRNQLNYLRAYLYTCREPIIEELQKQMWPREYMYEHIHQYSISDLMQVKDGSLAEQLEKVVKFGTDHVLNCWLCSQKGFLCEICNLSKPLFPFDTRNVYRCNLCSGVFHKTCQDSLKPCPRCKRKKDREDAPLHDAE